MATKRAAARSQTGVVEAQFARVANQGSARHPQLAEYAVMHPLADGVYQVVTIDEDDADASTRAAQCKHPGGVACRIETREQLFTFARATAAKKKAGGGLAIRLDDAQNR